MITEKEAIVAVLGASNKPERYSNKAVRLLREKGYPVIPIHPTLSEVEGIPVASSLAEITEAVHTLSVYINPKIITSYTEDILALNPKRVILNPGTESEELEQVLQKNNIPFIEACTLVLLKTDQF